MRITTHVIGFLALSLGCQVGSGAGSHEHVSPAVDSLKTRPSFRTVKNRAFTKGEELVYDVNYGFVTAGEATITIPEYRTIRGRKCYHVLFHVKSKPFFDVFYKVRDRYETYIDTRGIFPWKFEQHIREGGYSRDFIVSFDHYTRKAITKDRNYDIPLYVQDIMSALFYVRTMNFDGFRPGQKVWLRNFYKDSTYTLGVKYLGRQEIDVEAGTFKTIILQPLISEGGLFKASGRIFVWVSDDERKIPVQVKAEIPIGSIVGELIRYRGVRLPLRGKIDD